MRSIVVFDDSYIESIATTPSASAGSKNGN